MLDRPIQALKRFRIEKNFDDYNAVEAMSIELSYQNRAIVLKVLPSCPTPEVRIEIEFRILLKMCSFCKKIKKIILCKYDVMFCL